MERVWPVPFGGITWVTEMSRSDILRVIASFSDGCGKGHAHNIAVQFDGDKVYVSNLGADCIRELLHGN